MNFGSDLRTKERDSWEVFVFEILERLDFRLASLETRAVSLARLGSFLTTRISRLGLATFSLGKILYELLSILLSFLSLSRLIKFYCNRTFLLDLTLLSLVSRYWTVP